jgi:hypothetical protein
MTDADLDAMERHAEQLAKNLPGTWAREVANYVPKLVAEVRRLRSATQPEVMKHTNPPVVFMPSRANPPGVATA